MKSNTLGSILFLTLVPAVAETSDFYKRPDPVDASEVATSTLLSGGEKPNPQHLREALRQSVERMDGNLKPHHLTSEERRLLREQLRSQSPQTIHNK